MQNNKRNHAEVITRNSNDNNKVHRRKYTNASDVVNAIHNAHDIAEELI